MLKQITLGLLFLIFLAVSCSKIESIAPFSYNASKYDGIDPTVMSVPQNIQDNIFNDPETYLVPLINYLKGGAPNESTIAKRIHDWIAINIFYDYEMYSFYDSDVSKYVDLWDKRCSDIYEILKRRTGVCSCYAILFVEMATLAGLEAVYVGGYTSKIDPESSGHAWNAVKIDGKWEPLDVTWDAGGFNPVNFQAVTKGLSKGYSTYYWCTNHESFRESHFPDNTNFEFTDPVITLEEWQNSPDHYDLYFTQNANLISPIAYSINTNKQYQFRIIVPEAYSVRLQYAHDTGNNNPYVLFSLGNNNIFALDYALNSENSNYCFIEASFEGSNSNWQLLLYYNLNSN